MRSRLRSLVKYQHAHRALDEWNRARSSLPGERPLVAKDISSIARAAVDSAHDGADAIRVYENVTQWNRAHSAFPGERPLGKQDRTDVTIDALERDLSVSELIKDLDRNPQGYVDYIRAH